MADEQVAHVRASIVEPPKFGQNRSLFFPRLAGELGTPFSLDSTHLYFVLILTVLHDTWKK